MLDYADVIPSNSVERPFLKPVVLAGDATTGEKKRLIDRLVAEFPDVFGFAPRTTTRPEGFGKPAERRRRFNEHGKSTVVSFVMFFCFRPSSSPPS